MSMILVPNGIFSQMVAIARTTYYEEEQPALRHYGSRGHGYPLSDRHLPSGPSHNVYSRNPYIGIQDSRHHNHSPDQDETRRTRSRIPVACGRCRKRKIRCSGDNGGPCTNCKSAGNDICQFLRVSSTETTMIKNETPVFDFDSGSASSRLNCHLVPYGPHAHTAQSPPLALNSYPSRNNSLSAYQYPVKQFYSVPNYGEIGEENVDYGLQLNLNTFHGEQMGLGSNCVPTPSRTWASTPQLKNLPFLEQQTPVYSHGQSSYNGTNFDARPNISPESKQTHLTTVRQPLPSQPLSSQTLPTPINTGMDRLLPFPAPVPINRPSQVSQFLSPTDGLLSGTHDRGSYVDYSSPQTLKSDSSSKNSNSASNNATPENSTMSTTSYQPPVDQSPEPLNSSQADYSTSSFSMPSSQPEVYTTLQNSHHGILNANEASNSYDHSSNISYERRGSYASYKGSSVSSQGGYHPDGLPSTTNGTLVNGHRYYPASSGLASNQYPAPPINIQPQARRPSGVLA